MSFSQASAPPAPVLADGPLPVLGRDVRVPLSGGAEVPYAPLDYAPFGAGVLAGRADWLEQAEPYLAGGGASRSVVRDADGALHAEWHGGTARHEAGSPNVLGAYAIAAACRALAEAGPARLAAREEELLTRLRAGLRDIPRARELSLFGEDAERVGVLSFVVEGWDSGRLASALSAEYGIGVRDGLFCAHPLLRHLRGAGAREPAECGAPAPPDGSRIGAVRVSFGVGTEDEHIERLLRAVAELAARFPAPPEGSQASRPMANAASRSCCE